MEREREDFGEGPQFEAIVTGEGNNCVRCDEFAQDLTAASAGRTGSGVEICNRNSDDPVTRAAFADRARERAAFGADGQSEGHILNIAAGGDESIVEKQGSAYPKARVGGVGIRGCLTGGFLKPFDGGGVNCKRRTLGAANLAWCF